MITLALVAVAIAVYAAIYNHLARRAEPARIDAAYEAALAEAESEVIRILLRVSRPLARSKMVRASADSPAYQAVRARLLAAGGAYGGSVEIFLSVQFFLAFAAAIVIAALIVSDVEPFMMVVGAVLAGGLCALPWNRVDSAARARAEAITSALPEFAELLLMPLSAGMGVIPALRFTAAHTSGPVSVEVRRLLERLDARSVPERQAFKDAADALGTLEAQAFFNALAQAHLEGTRLSETLSAQAEQLRKIAFQAARARIKRLPVSLVLIMAVHFIPTLLVIVAVPTFLSFTDL